MTSPPGAQPPDIGELLDDLSVRMERVRVLYEQYFMGIEKIEPMVARKDISRHMLVLQQNYIRNTGLRFRFNTMLQKWNIYVTYWNRILREIENGTYTRHVQKAARRAQSEGRELPREMLPPQQRANVDETQRIHDDDSWPGVPLGTRPAVEDHRTEPGFERIQPPPAAEPLFPPPPPKDAPPPPHRMAAPPRPPATPEARAAATLRPPPPSPTPHATPPVPGMNEDELRALHKRFVATRAMNGETARVSYETLVNSLAKQVPKVLQQAGAKSVRFEVAVQNGRAILKAIPTK